MGMNEDTICKPLAQLCRGNNIGFYASYLLDFIGRTMTRSTLAPAFLTGSIEGLLECQ